MFPRDLAGFLRVDKAFQDMAGFFAPSFHPLVTRILSLSLFCRFSLDTIPPDSIVLDYTEFRRDNFGRPIFPRSFDSLFLYTNAFFSPPILCTFGIFVVRFFVDVSSLETMELFVG